MARWVQIFRPASDMLRMNRSTRKALKTALSISIAVLVTGLVFFLVAKYAPEDPFVDSGFVQDVGKQNQY